jgi:hypothetical protein
LRESFSSSYPIVEFGGTSLLSLLINDPAYMANRLRQDLWRAGHAHAGVLLILSLVALRYVDEAMLSERAKQMVRSAIPASSILLPTAFFLRIRGTVDQQRPANVNCEFETGKRAQNGGGLPPVRHGAVERDEPDAGL